MKPIASRIRKVTATLGKRVVETAIQEADGLLDLSRLHSLGPDLLGQPGEELVQSRVRDRTAELRVDLRIDRARRDDPLEEPDRRAGGESLELGCPEHSASTEVFEHTGIREPRRAPERSPSAVQAPRPAVRIGESLGHREIGHGEGRERAQPLPIGGCLVERPRESG